MFNRNNRRFIWIAVLAVLAIGTLPAAAAAAGPAPASKTTTTSPGWFGVGIQTLTPEIAKDQGLKFASGVLIKMVTPGGPVDKAGIKAGDIFLKFNGQVASTAFAMSSILDRTPAGKSVNAILLRNGKQYSAAILVTPMPVEMVADRKPIADPILRIETGMHVSTISAISADRSCRLLVSSSKDKTVRLWAVEPGRGQGLRLLRTLRVPINRGGGGKIFAAAISPDGRFIAAGGMDAQSREGGHRIYIFDSNSGQIVHRLGAYEHASIVLKLTFSDDGRYLAVTLGHNIGVRVYDTGNWKLIFRDTDYQGYSYGAAFDSKNWLYTVSYDGHLRLYDPQFRLRSKVKTRGGIRPFNVAVHPGNKRIAVGFADSSRVDLYRARDLTFLRAASASKGNGNLAILAWSPGGQRLYAGGRHQGKKNRIHPIIIWDRLGEHKEGELRTEANNTIFGIKTCGANLFMGSGDPILTYLDQSGRRLALRRGVSSDMRGKVGKRFLLSDHGYRVRFGLGSGGKDPIIFDVGQGLNPVGAPKRLNQPDVTSLAVTGWEDSRKSKFNGTVLPLKKLEISRSLAVDPYRRGFILGAEWHLYSFLANGSQLWEKSMSSTSWGVNISRDGRLVVVAVGDGTIRWHRMSDGKELLALFVNANDQRWVAWTPKGYYMSSPGGDDLIGWHVNREWDQTADFFPASQFRNTFYRPDIVQRVLFDLDEEKSVAEANRLSGRSAKKLIVRNVLPPVIEILPPTGGTDFATDKVSISYHLRTPSKAAISRVEVLIDGRPLANRGLGQVKTRTGQTHSLTIPVPGRDVEISLIARTASAASVPARIKLHWTGGKAQAGEIIKPKLYALLIGVSQYDQKHLRLGYAAKDAKDLAAALKTQAGGVYREVVIKVLTDREATAGNIHDALDWLEGEVTSRDVGLLFMAGHGVTDAKQRFYYIPVDGDPKKLRRTAIAQSDIRDIVGSLAGKALMFIDACHSGQSIDNRRTRGTADITAIVNDMASAENGVVMYASSTGREVSEESDVWQNGAFTEALLEGFKGKADYSKDGVISIAELDLWLSERVKVLTNKRQHPVMRRPATVPDFPIALVK